MQIVADAQQIQVLLFGTFWNLKTSIFYLQLFEAVDAEPTGMEGANYSISHQK